MFIDYFVTVHLTVLGIFENRKYKNYEKYLSTLIIVTDIIIFISFIIVFPQADLFVHRCNIITTMFGAFIFCLHRSIAISKKEQLLRVIKILRSDPPYLNENFVKINTAVLLSENFYPTFGKMLSLLVILGILPFTQVLYQDNIDYNDPVLYVIPYLFHFRDVHSFGGFALLQLLQCVTIGHFALIYFSFVGLINYVVCNIKAHIAELNSQINNLIDDSALRCEKRGKVAMLKRDSDELLVDQFINVIRYQLYIQRYIKNIADFFGSILSYYVLQFVLLAFGFTVLGAKMLENSVSTLLQSFSPLILFLYGFYTWCNVCEAIGSTNEWLLRSLYNTEWYTFPLEMRKLLFLTMMHTQQARNIRAFGIFVINFGLGLQVLKAIYSMVNYLLVKRNNML